MEVIRLNFRERPAVEYVEAARRHKDSTPEFIEQAYELMKSSPHEITTGVSELGKLIQKRSNAVLFEVYKLGCYVRLTPYPEMILIGEVEPEHDSGYLIAFWLADRFRKFIVLIFTSNGYNAITKRTDLQSIPKFTGDKERIITQIREFASNSYNDRLHEDFIQLDGDKLWKDYYETQFLSQRLNLKAYHRDIPKYMFKKAGMEIEREFFDIVTDKHKKNRKLDEFL